jgi:IS605 OrfB family transposase
LSISTLAGRLKIPFVTGDHQWDLLKNPCGQADLLLRDGLWYLYVSVEVPDRYGPDPLPSRFLGVDLGIVHVATDSDGVHYSGTMVEKKRVAVQKLRSALQRAGTKSAKRHLKIIAHKESRFRSHNNHVISKTLVARAKDTGRGLALEDLKGIGVWKTVRKSQRAELGSWAFGQFRLFTTYKAARAGVILVIVEARDTSSTCPRCGYCDGRNRRSQSIFICRSCEYAANADYVGACNIAKKGSVSGPIVPIDDSSNREYRQAFQDKTRRDLEQGSG